MSQSRPRLVAVIEPDACTGCGACVDFCLVDCIEEPQAEPASTRMHIRQDECIGCRLCAKVCDHLDVHAVRLVPAETVSTPILTNAA